MLQLVLFVCVLEGGWGVVGVRLGVGSPCPPLRYYTETPRHLFLNKILLAPLSSLSRFHLPLSVSLIIGTRHVRLQRTIRLQSGSAGEIGRRRHGIDSDPKRVGSMLLESAAGRSGQLGPRRCLVRRAHQPLQLPSLR